MSYAIAQLESALTNNAKCRTGLLASQRIFHTPRGPSGGAELLTLVFADEKHLGYWYGHVIRSPSSLEVGGYLALLVPLKVFVNAGSPELLFRRFRYWTSTVGEFWVASIQEEEDVFAVRDTFEEAGLALADMIRRFDPELRNLDPDCPDGVPHGTRLDHRSFTAFQVEEGLRDILLRRDGFIPAPPMETPRPVLTVLQSRGPTRPSVPPEPERYPG